MNHSQHKTDADFYPLALGNEWTYLREGDDANPGEDVMTINVVHEEQAASGRVLSLWMNISADRFEPQIITETQEGLFDGDWCIMKFPIQKGEQWQHDGFSFEVKEIGNELLVGAHAFSEYVVIRRIHRARTVDVTYAKGIGPVLFSEFDTVGPTPFKSAAKIISWKVN